MKLRFLLPMFFLVIASAGLAHAQGTSPIGVTYTVSGSAGNWVLNFSVTNNVVAGQSVYFFGVLLPAQKIVKSPAGWVNCASSCRTTTWNPSNFSGIDPGVTSNAPDLTYNNIWLDTGNVGVSFGQTLSGFEAGVNTTAAPTSVQWVAYSVDPTFSTTKSFPYTGGANFSYSGDCQAVLGDSCAVQSVENPGFAGIATPNASTCELNVTKLYQAVNASGDIQPWACDIYNHPFGTYSSKYCSTGPLEFRIAQEGCA